MTHSAPHISIEELLAIEEIKQLKATYLRAVDDKAYDTIASVFAADAIVDFTGEARHHVGHHGVAAGASDAPAQPFHGGAAAAAGIRDAVNDLVTVHHCHDPQIRMTGPDAASGLWSLYNILDYGHEVMHGYGTYDEEYVLVDDRWYIRRLTLTRRRVVWEQRPTP